MPRTRCLPRVKARAANNLFGGKHFGHILVGNVIADGELLTSEKVKPFLSGHVQLPIVTTILY